MDTVCFTRAQTAEIARRVAEADECEEKLAEVSSRADTLELAVASAERRIDNLILSNNLLKQDKEDLIEVNKTQEGMLLRAVEGEEKQSRQKKIFIVTTIVALFVAIL